MQPGAVCVDLHGEPAGAVTAEQAEGARLRLSARKQSIPVKAAPQAKSTAYRRQQEPKPTGNVDIRSVSADAPPATAAPPARIEPPPTKRASLADLREAARQRREAAA